MDKEAWHAAIHRVTKSRTPLGDWTELNQTGGREIPTSAASNPLEGTGGWEDLVKFTVQEHKSTKRMRPNQRTIEHILFPYNFAL